MAFEEGVELLRRTPTLVTGVHLTFGGEKPVLPPEQIPTLVRSDGRFHNRWQFLRLLAWGRIQLNEIRREWGAQIRKCLNAGLNIAHLDSDDHLHVIPGLWKIAVELCHQFGIPALRRPREGLLHAPDGFTMGTLKKAGILAMAALCPKDVLARSDYCVGLSISGHLNSGYLAYILTHLREGTTELICHPGFVDELLLQRYGHWGYDWEGEVKALTSSALKSLLADHRVTLAN